MSEMENGQPAPGLTEASEPVPAGPRVSPVSEGVEGSTSPARLAPAKPRIGDTRPAPAARADAQPGSVPIPERTRHSPAPTANAAVNWSLPAETIRRGDGVAALMHEEPADAEGSDDGTPEESRARRSRNRRRSSRDRKGKSVGRYLVCVHVGSDATQISMLEGRSLVEHYVSRVADETTQIDGNVYLGRVQNVLPGMEAAFVDIGIPKNAVLYRGDVHYDVDDVEGGERSESAQPRIEDVLRGGQMILCQVTKNPIGAKGARLTQEVSLPGRFAVLVPNSSAFGISKRLGDNERRRLRKIIDDVRPAGHGLIVRTAAEGASAEELRRDVDSLVEQWKVIEAEAARSNGPRLLYREPDLAVRILREELNAEYRGVIIDDPTLYQQVRAYVANVSPELAERVEYYDTSVEPLPIFERYHVHEQLHKALDRKVWLPSGGSLIIERTEALTVIDVNTGKNVGKTNLEETVYRNNLEAAEEVARQLRLRDIGGIIVIDFIDMEIRENREKVAAALRKALARDKTRTQAFDISELGLVEMTRKRISEGLLESMSSVCEFCHGRGIILDSSFP
jgi:ribonuclease E